MVYTFSLSVTVAGTPTGLTATRLNSGLTHVQLSWSSVSGVAGYEVFYQLSSGSSSVMSAGTTTNTMLNIISGLSILNMYNFFVVSYGNEGSTVLPSDHSNNVTLTFTSEFINGNLKQNSNDTQILSVTYVGVFSAFLITSIFSSIFTVSGFNVIKINNTAVLAMWQPITAPEVKHYTVYYISTSKCNRQSDMDNKTFPAGSNEGVIGGLQDNLNYLFSLSVTYEINGVDYEGERTQLIPPGKTFIIF